MQTLDPDWWQVVTPYLDQALEMPEEERAAWLATLGERNSALAAKLRVLLEEHRALASEGFLEKRPAALPSAPGLSGQSIGPYRLISQIGQGGMGSVWLAERSDGRFARRVAVKFLSIALVGRGGEERFKREGSILGRLAHPHIAELIDAGVTPNSEPYLVLEHVEGRHIDQYCDQRMLGTDSRISLFLDVLSAVAQAHANLVVHRDIKPSNVLVRNDGQVKLLDFGIAKLLADEENPVAATLMTLEGGAALTPQFAAPEQVTGGTVTTGTDVYTLGVLLYLLLTGQHPAGPGPHSPADLVKAIVDAEPLRASEALTSPEANPIAEKRSTTPDKLRRQLRGDLDTILGKALKKNPAERYSSIAALADDLRRYLKHEPISARPDALAYRTSKFVRRNRTAVALATLAFFAVLAGVTGTLMQARTTRQQRDSALRERDRANRMADFMARMFKLSDPSQVRGNTITAREILDQSSRNIDTELVKDPELQAQMMHSMGKAYEGLGLNPVAESLLQRAIDVGRRAHGPEDPEVLSAMNDLGVVLFYEGRLADAEKLQREALAIERRALGPENPITLDNLPDLVYTLSEEGRNGQEGRNAEALDLARQTLDIQRRVLGVENPYTLWTMNMLAVTLDRGGHAAEAEKLQREALDIERRVHGPDSTGALNAMSNLGGTLIDMGRLREAEDMLRQVLEIERRVYGPQHQETGAAMYNLACVIARQGRRDEAFSVLRQAVETTYPKTLLMIEKDSDLDSLHADPRWKSILEIARQRVTAVQKTK